MAAARGVPEERARIGCGLHHRARSALGRRRSRAWRPRATSSCSIGWTRRGATSCCRRRATMTSCAAPSRCARRCGPIRSRFRWRGFSHRRQQALGRRPRLPRRHAAPRHQALFRIDRFRARRYRRLARRPQAVSFSFPPPFTGETPRLGLDPRVASDLCRPGALSFHLPSRTPGLPELGRGWDTPKQKNGVFPTGAWAQAGWGVGG